MHVYDYLSAAELEIKFFEKEKIPAESYRAFDPLSIMWYQVPEEFLTTPINQRTRSVLSASDKEFIAELYPR